MSKQQQPTILITGGTGFAGSHLTEALLAQNQPNIHVTSYRDSPGFVQDLIPSEQVHQLDLTDAEATNNLINQVKPTQLYHLAATSQVGDSFDQIKKVIENNLVLQLNILNAISDHAPNCKLLIVGSAMEYQAKDTPLKEADPLGPTSPYAVSKVMQDMLGYYFQQAYQLKIIRVRPFNHIGERQPPGFVVSDFAKQIVAIEKGEQTEIRVGNLEAVRDFTDVKDMAQAYILVMNQGKLGEVYNLGSGQGHQIKDILSILKQLANKKIKVVDDQQKYRPLDVPVVIADNSKVRTLGWQATVPIEDTLKRILNWWRKNY